MFKNHTENLTFISGFLIWIRERLEIRLDLFYDFVHPSYVHMHTYISISQSKTVIFWFISLILN